MSHYFSPRPAGPEGPTTLNVHLAGRDLRLEGGAGVFSGHRLDLGTSVLLRTTAQHPGTLPAGGDLLDLGCGWGPIAISMGLGAPGARVWAVDVNERAVALAGRNARRAGATNVTACTPEEVDPDLRFAAIWSNPPIRIGKAALHELLTTWLGRLEPGGHAVLVVQRNLGADSLHRWLDEDLGMPTVRLASAKGFRVLEVTRPE